MRSFTILITLVATSLPFTLGIGLAISGANEIQTTASRLATSLLSFYLPSDPVGVLPAPYYWWEAGGMWGGLLDYWHYTGDAQYNDKVSAALAANMGTGLDFMGPYTDGNDDQGWWALAAMSAYEYGLPAAPGVPDWIVLAENVWNEMNGRWDMGSCNGGLKWKIGVGADGWHYKNAVSNGIFFQLSARLFRATGNMQYLDMSFTIFSWVQSVGLIDKNTWAVYDGTDDTIACSRVDHDQWSYNVGLFLYGAAVLQSLPTPDPKWAVRATGLLGAAKRFFTNGIMVENMCEPQGTCNVDQLSFKAYLARYMAGTAVVFPALKSVIYPLLTSSAAGAVTSCAAGPSAQTCGLKWTIDGWDQTMGVGQQLAALEVVHGLLAFQPTTPVRRLERLDRRRVFSVWHK